MTKTENKTIIDVPPGAYYFGDPAFVLPAHIWTNFMKYLKEHGHDSAALQNVEGKGFIGAIRIDSDYEPLFFKAGDGVEYKVVSGFFGVVSRNLIPGASGQRPGAFSKGSIIETLGTHPLVYDGLGHVSFFGETIPLLVAEVEEDDDDDAFEDDDEDSFDDEEDSEDSDEEE